MKQCLILFSFLLLNFAGTKVIAAEVCPNALIDTLELERALFNPLPERYLLQVIESHRDNMKEYEKKLMEEIRKIEQLMVNLEGQLREGRIDYSAPAPIAGKLNLSTFIFQEVFLNYSIVIGYDDKQSYGRIEDNIDYITLYVINTYQQRMRFLLRHLRREDEKVNLDAIEDEHGNKFNYM